MTTKRFPWARAFKILCVIPMFWGLSAQALSTNFVDTFDAALDPNYTFIDQQNHTYTTNGVYQINTNGFVRFPCPASGDWTADVVLRWEDFGSANTELKVRLFGDEFTEAVINRNNDNIRVFQGGGPGNFVLESGLGLDTNVNLNLRFAYNDAEATLRFGFSQGGAPIQFLGESVGIPGGFTPNLIDFGLNNSTDGVALIETFQLRDFRLPIGIDDWVDEFDGTELVDIYDVNGNAANHIGLNGAGQYEVNNASAGGFAGLNFNLGGEIGDFTADVRFIPTAFNAAGNVQALFRFFGVPGAQFMEFKVNMNNDNLQVFSAELGMNFINEGGIGYATNVPINLRLTYNDTSGDVKIGFSQNNDPYELMGAASGLSNFQTANIDFGIRNGDTNAVLLIDRFALYDEIIPIGIATFEDPFDGPTLDPSWDLVQAGDHVGFTGGGQYEITKTGLGEAGLSREFGGQADFVSTVEFQVQDFIGSDSEIQFRHPVSGGSLDVILDSVGDIRVEANAATVAELSGFQFQDGESLEIIVSSTDAGGGSTEVGLRRNGGDALRIAVLETAYLAESNEVVVVKNGAGNGNSPRLLLDHYFLDAGFVAVPLSPFSGEFTGPTLDGSWFTSDSGTGSLVGFNNRGQYEISTEANVTAGLSRFIGFAGDTTFTLTARLADFIGTESELRFALTGADALTAILRSDDSLEIVSDEFGSVFTTSGLGLSDGDLVTLQFTITPEFGDWEFGLGVNGDPEFVASDVGYANLNPTQMEIEVARGAGGSLPSILLDQATVSEGFNLIPQAAEAFSDDFNAGLGAGWNQTRPADHTPSVSNMYYAIEVVTNSAVNINRFLAPNGFAGVPVGSFSAFLDVRFEDFIGGTGSGGGSDFKFQIGGGNGMELVFNTFLNVRFFTANNGQSWFNPPGAELPDFVNGDTVNFGIVYDATGPSVTMSVGLNGTNVITETRSNLVGVAPETLTINGFRFNFANPGLNPTFLVDQLDINAGLGGLDPGEMTLAPAYDGLQEITWNVGILESAPDIEGPWNEVPGATSPYLLEPTEVNEFLRIQNN